MPIHGHIFGWQFEPVM